MRIAGNYTFEATREEVWSAINDPEVLARTIPGCQRLEQIGENEYESTLKVGLAAVRGTYDGRVKIDNHVPPESYTIHVDGKGSNGFLKGTGSIKLREDGAHTVLDYGGEAQVGGTIASVGQRLLDGASKTLINQSLKALAQRIEERRTPAAAPATSATPASTETSPAQPNASTTQLARQLDAEGAEAAPVAASLAAPAEASPAQTNASITQMARQLDVEGPEAVAAASAPSFERRTITVPPGQGLSEADLARGAAEDFLKERPWLPWMFVAFLVGYLLGRRS